MRSVQLVLDAGAAVSDGVPARMPHLPELPPEVWLLPAALLPAALLPAALLPGSLLPDGMPGSLPDVPRALRGALPDGMPHDAA